MPGAAAGPSGRPPRFRHGRQRCALTLYALLAVAALPARPPGPWPAPPQVLFKDLFVAVQSAAVFPDGKTFADAVPRDAPDVILARYQRVHPATNAALRAFVAANFTLPAPVAAAPAQPERATVGAHIDALWSQLTRSTPSVVPWSSLLPLPKPYVVPGGRFREIYYWDSYFTMLGLEESGRRDLVRDMVDDFAHLIDAYGHVPNGTRSYYLSRSQPPFFFEMVALLAPGKPGPSFGHYLVQLKREYAFWMEGEAGLAPGAAHRRVVKLDDGTILNRYWDDRDTPRDEAYREDTALARGSGRAPAQVYRDLRAAAESGWDFSSRWFADPKSRASIDTTQILPVDLNSLLFGLENAIRAGCEYAGDSACASEFAHRAQARRAAVDRYLWDVGAGVYFDYRFGAHAAVRRISAATFYPLFVALASEAQARAVAALARRQLLDPGGIVTTPLVTGQQWDAPNGWAPVQWIAIAGLGHYREQALARSIACRWMANVEEVYQRTGKLVEKYDVVTVGQKGRGGEYPTQDGFGWTNGVLRKLLVLYPDFASGAPAQGCPPPP
jgi:alpha,alpha-trehalase